MAILVALRHSRPRVSSASRRYIFTFPSSQPLHNNTPPRTTSPAFALTCLLPPPPRTRTIPPSATLPTTPSRSTLCPASTSTFSTSPRPPLPPYPPPHSPRPPRGPKHHPISGTRTCHPPSQPSTRHTAQSVHSPEFKSTPSSRAQSVWAPL